MPRRIGLPIRAAAFSCLIAALLAAQPASPHRRAANADDSGIAIPALTHGQMAVIADHRAEILALAARLPRTDERFRRLLNFGKLQHTYCLWGLVPGSLRDEASPFNECSHAYLSATQALLVAMRNMNDPRSPLGGEIEALVSRIDAEMVRKGASFVLCQYSADGFNTASLVRPDLAAVPFHAPSAFSFAALALAMGAGVVGLARGRTSRQAAP